MAEGTILPGLNDGGIDFDACVAQYQRIQPELEDAAWGEFAAIDARGNYAVAKKRAEAIDSFRQRFGRDDVTTFYIGRR